MATKGRMRRFLFAFVFMLTLADLGVAEMPRLPYEHWGACPFVLHLSEVDQPW
jgi:hypothetical protein